MHFSTLLFLAASSIPTIYAQEVVVEGTKLINWDSCDSGQQKVIKEAWVDAIKLAEGAKNIQWNSAAALEFLGAQAYNKEDQPKIQGILNNVATFDPAWWFNPFAEKIQVSCKQTTLCGGFAAYTQNKPEAGNDPLINFCDPFFRTDSLSRVIEKGKKERERDVKYNLNSYINRGYIFLHEMIHVDKIVKPIGGKSIRDLYIAYRDATGKRRERKVYGPYLTKLLACVTRMDGHDVGYWIRSTADNMAWYAMAVYVEKQLGNTFPSLPLAEGSVKEIWGDWNAGAGMLQVKDEGLFNKLADNAYELADIPGDKVVVELKDIEFTTDKDYPEWYTNELKKWKQAEKSSKEVQSTTTSSPAYVHESKGDENIDCRKEPSMDDLAQPYVPLSWAESKIEEACEIFKGIELNPTSQRQLYLPFSIEGSQNTLKIGALWNVGNLECKTGRKVDLKECVDSMKKVLNSCDTGTRKYKHGGEKVSNCIVFAVAVDGVGGYNPDIGKVFECEIAQGIRGDVGKCACNGNIQLDRDSKGGCDLHKGKYPCGEPGCKRKKTRRDLWNH